MPADSSQPGPRSQPLAAPPPPAVLRAVDEAVSRLRYGIIQLTVHDGKVVQLDVTERQRFG